MLGYNEMLLIGALLVTAVAVPLGVLAVLLVKSLSPPLPARLWPYLLGLVAAWLGTLPVCGWLISATDLVHANWGHAGEALFFPFFVLSPVYFWLGIARVRKMLGA